ncbi:MAG TPA: tRNA glutamyl-Q(34) synthetase GluQRS [Usitatibacteraceae bacterium]|jgi:glutamyl-Q tRNA(Asp) synthetase|nr:tRNA glutamyl-Q(34) synthetase GluQRS [Burkholderiales bacterium]HQY46662.1 tRNA glutamyl-Q(34) synthetase GluQRS [Usitatibacteraceae bacterium]HRA22070.1 tRNA glutamyl-Q(34) synthetase GluQRS [Usitatibacteraceae bacterium]
MTAARYIGRFAPSPTGPLHFGSLVAAVASWLDARAAGGQWHLRIEDVDAPRTVPGAEDAILRTLEALGLAWDGPVVRQRDRAARYAEALEKLRAGGLAYRCRCSRREIADSGVHGIDGIVYPGTCRHAAVPDDAPAATRFLAAPGEVSFDDRVQGRVSQRLADEVGDFVVHRRDGLFAYQLAVVVDDADLGVTDVVRGADLLDSTPRQVALQRALGLPTPRYLHFPVATRGGEKLSKQTLAPAVDAAGGLAALGAALAFLGQPVPPADAPPGLLAVAARQWEPARIPRLRARDVAEGGAHAYPRSL